MFYKINEKYQEGIITKIKQLENLSDKEFQYTDYLLKLYEFESVIKDLKQHSDECLSNFLQYINFQEHAIRIYKHETDEMFFELAFAVTGTHNNIKHIFFIIIKWTITYI